jgi:hypothetical protein
MFQILRKDLLFILAVVAVFVSLSYAIGFVTDRKPETVELQTAFLSGAHPKAQPTTTRVWRKPQFEQTAVLDSATLKSPEKMQANNNGNIFVLDWSDLLVKEFSPDGKLLKVFGEEVGSPGALVNPTGFALDSAGNMWMCDLKQDRIGVFSAGGSNTKSYRPKNTVYRMAAIGDVMFTMVTPHYNSLFQTYDLAGQQLKVFGELLEDQASKGLVLDGDIVADVENRGIVYGGRYLGIIGAFDVEGKQRFLVQTIDNVPQPTVMSIDGKMRKVNPNTARPVLSLSVVNNELFVLSGVHPDGSAARGGKIMDVYDKQDGHYLYSWELPADAHEAIVASNYIYIRTDKKISIHRLHRQD